MSRPQPLLATATPFPVPVERSMVLSAVGKVSAAQAEMARYLIDGDFGPWFAFADEVAALLTEGLRLVLEVEAARFSGQTREAVGPNRVPGRRMLYFVAQHCVLLARQMARCGHSATAVYQGLMHESDEVVWGDFPSPAKSLLPAELRALIKCSGHAIDARFEVGHGHHALVKRYDLRMLATEKRDLMPYANCDAWRAISGIEPFDFVIDPWPADEAARRFIEFYHQVRSVLDAR